jgi:hypothetical protein
MVVASQGLSLAVVVLLYTVSYKILTRTISYEGRNADASCARKTHDGCVRILLVGHASTLVARMPSMAHFSAEYAFVFTNSKWHNLKKCKKNKEL